MPKILKSNKFLKSSAFTLIELTIVIALLTFLTAFVVISINPVKLIAGGRNTQRTNDINKIRVAISRFVSESDSNGNLRHLYNIPGYTTLITNSLNTAGVGCVDGSKGTFTNVSGAYDVATSGSNILDISSLINEKYMTSVLLDPTQVKYKVCIDPNNSFKLVIFSPTKETSFNYIYSVVDINPSPNVNYLNNPNGATDTEQWGQSNATLWHTSTGSSYFTGNGNTYWYLTPDSVPHKTGYVQAVTGISSSDYLATGQFYTFSTYVDKGTYTGVMHIEIKYTPDNSNWFGNSVVVTTPGRYSVSTPVAIPSNTISLQVAISGDGQGSLDPFGTYYFDNSQLEIGASATEYFDGSSGSAPLYGWFGTPHFFPSYKLE